MKITIFGLTISSSWGNGHATPYRAIIRALARQGHQVTFYEKDVEYYYWRRDLKDCDYCNLVLYPGWDDIRKEALGEAEHSDAVIIGSYCPEGVRIIEDVLCLARPLKVFYDLDTPITLSRLDGSDVDYLRRDQMPGFDLYLSFTGGEILKELELRWGVQKARALYGCVDPEVHGRVTAVEKFDCDLSYMGTYAADRQDKVEELFLTPARMLSSSTFVLAGPLYPKQWTWPQNVRRFDHVAPSDHPALYSSSRATLNVTRDGMASRGYCPSGRFFEAAACGTPIISDRFKGLDTFFAIGEEILAVSNAEDVVNALRRPVGELLQIAAKGRERTLAEHTGEARARELVGYLEEASSCRTESAAEVSSSVEVTS